MCQRLSWFRREVLGMPRPVMAKKLEIDGSQLSRHEHGLVPLRFSLADKIGKVFNLNQVWLACGTGRATPYLITPDDVLSKIPGQMSFLEAYETYLKLTFQEADHYALFSMAAVLGDEPPVFPKGIDERFYLRHTLKSIEEVFEDSPRKIRGEFLRRLVRAVSAFAADFDDDLDAKKAAPKKKC